MEQYFKGFVDDIDREIFCERLAICIYDGGLTDWDAACEALRAAKQFNEKRVVSELNNLTEKVKNIDNTIDFFHKNYVKGIVA